MGLRAATVEDVRDTMTGITRGLVASSARQYVLRIKSLLGYAHSLGFTPFNAGARIKVRSDGGGYEMMVRIAGDQNGELATMTLYEHLPDDIRQAVDDIVEVLRPEPWPDRFAALYGLLLDKLEERTASDPSHLLQEWSGIVTAVLEQLSPDGSVVECLALMSISFNDQWRAQAIARMDRDPHVFDQLCSIYPDWAAIVDDLAEAQLKRPLNKTS